MHFKYFTLYIATTALLWNDITAQTADGQGGGPPPDAEGGGGGVEGGRPPPDGEGGGGGGEGGRPPLCSDVGEGPTAMPQSGNIDCVDSPGNTTNEGSIFDSVGSNVMTGSTSDEDSSAFWRSFPIVSGLTGVAALFGSLALC